MKNGYVKYWSRIREKKTDSRWTDEIENMFEVNQMRIVQDKSGKILDKSLSKKL